MYTFYRPMPASNPRKRPAPGSMPIPQHQQPQIPQTYNNTPEQMLRWNGSNTGNFADNAANSVNPYAMMTPPQATFSQAAPSPSNALARRGLNNALVPANHSFPPQSNDPWPTYSDDNMLSAQTNGSLDEHDNVELLEEKAQRAKRDAQTKRKQIPPFVQKLNSFLETSKNTDLIRWSDKGDSFIVLDEDEFAKTLIPELFKHNNYASFVRQLNMYGFHKKVGLSDNSMKASERKNKSPSEYYNPYFRRGHPNLLWLINKPKSGNTKKGGKKRPDDGEGDSDDDAIPIEDSINQPFNPQNVPSRALPAPESGPLQKKELAVVRDQMAALQQRQKQISDAITRLRQEHNQLFQQALMFQNMHDRHENSINAILNFLANVFRKSLEEQGGAQNVNDLLASIIPNVQMQSQGQGSVVDLGDWIQQQPPNPAKVGTPKRPQRLLPPIPNDQPTPNSTPTQSATYSGFAGQQPQTGQVTELYDTPAESCNTPSYLKQELESNPQEGMLRLIQDTNTNAGKTGSVPMDLSDMAANTQANMTNDQRNRMLSIMSGTPSSASPTPGPSASSPSAATPKASAAANLELPTTSHEHNAKATSLSPVMSSAIPASIQRISQTQDELEQVQRLQDEQNQTMESLNSLLGPLSPSGRIPGLEDQNNYFGDDLDISQYLDSNAYAADGGGNDFNFDTTTFNDSGNLDWSAEMPDFGSSGLDNLEPGRVVEANTPSHETHSHSGTDEIRAEELDDRPPIKRQRMT
ncbi:hypothetical protein GGR57DRAFT_490067 [Xylariaceae sp. FL1272]|nr:hypothetical protein GGR57DRAFT_490067 [Xylariaceae sp. FL1272]